MFTDIREASTASILTRYPFTSCIILDYHLRSFPQIISHELPRSRRKSAGVALERKERHKKRIKSKRRPRSSTLLRSTIRLFAFLHAPFAISSSSDSIHPLAKPGDVDDARSLSLADLETIVF